MTPPRVWLRPPRALLLLLFLLTFVSVSALAIFGWRLLEGQRFIEAQHAQDRLEHAADRIAARIREALAKSSERLAKGRPLPGELLLELSGSSLTASPPGQLLYYPFPPPDPEPYSKTFEEPELFEFAESQPAEALRGFERLTRSANPAIRAGALLRTARVLRNLGRREESIAVYRELANSEESVAGVPAALAARLMICELSHNPQAAVDLRNDLSSGRWRLTRRQFEFYWSEAGRIAGTAASPPAEKSRLTQLAEFVWNDRMNHPESQGYQAEWIAGVPVVLIWRGAPDHRRVLVVRPESLLQGNPAAPGLHYAFVDAKGHTLAGVKDTSSHAVIRTGAGNDLPWTLFVSEQKLFGQNAVAAQRRFLLLVLAVMMLFLVLGTYFIARAIQREAEVQRMQSNFVSAVSHEFRSPLTSMRQLSEMLALGRVSSEERRQLYYETLVSETGRLQRLIESLLNFGRMEAGVRQYQFQEHDAVSIVESVVGDLAPQVAAAGKHIEFVKTETPLWIEADFDAISVALRNLLDNAIKYSPGCPTVCVACGFDRDRVAIGVRDHGFGIPDSERRTIFKKFVRGSAAAMANVKGSGVGLAMVSHIVAAHGGELTVTSEVGRGSIFTMLLPAAART
jgi:signal transduction histidine kinase